MAPALQLIKTITAKEAAKMDLVNFMLTVLSKMISAMSFLLALLYFGATSNLIYPHKIVCDVSHILTKKG